MIIVEQCGARALTAYRRAKAREEYETLSFFFSEVKIVFWVLMVFG